MSLEKKTKKGVLKYRLPNIAEGYYYMALFDNITTTADVLTMRGKIIEKMSDLVDYKSVGYDSYSELLDDKKNMREAIVEISKEIYNDVLDLTEKKL